MTTTTLRWRWPGTMPLSMASSVSLGPACSATLVTITSTVDVTSMRGYSRSSPQQAQAAALLGALVLGEGDVGLAVVGLLGQELVHAVLELGGDPPEGQPGRGRRAGSPAAAEHRPAAPSRRSPSVALPVLGEPTPDRCRSARRPTRAEAVERRTSGSTWARTSA